MFLTMKDSILQAEFVSILSAVHFTQHFIVHVKSLVGKSHNAQSDEQCVTESEEGYILILKKIVTVTGITSLVQTGPWRPWVK